MGLHEKNPTLEWQRESAQTAETEDMPAFAIREEEKIDHWLGRVLSDLALDTPGIEVTFPKDADKWQRCLPVVRKAVRKAPSEAPPSECRDLKSCALADSPIFGLNP